MFGQPTPFGSQAPAPAFGAPAPAFGAAPAPAFGAPAPAFGAPSAPAFGAAPATGFGAAPAGGSAFGQPAPATGFGAAAPAPAFGGFGAPAPAPTGFGAPAPGTSLFGNAPAPAGGGLFGSARAPAPSGGLFGSAPAPSTSIFGAPAPAATPFGSPAPAPAFGAPAPAGGLFGSAPAPAFGAPAPATGFGAAPAPAFGAAPAPAFGGSQFGAMGQQKPGTLAAPYQSTNKSDGTNQINLISLTAMSQYEGKSFEELRMEDYLAGNKGSQGQQPQQTGGFGGFGAATPAPAFGAPQPAPAPGLFGSAPAAAPTGGLFGSAPAPAPGGLFGGGAPAPAPTGGLFGAPAAPAPAFGAKPGGLFGSAPTPAPGPGLFGSAPAAPAAGGFGAAPAPAFGATPAPAFGAPAPAPTFGGFGAAPAPATGFGAPAPAPGGLFGSTPAPAPGGLFGSTPAPAPAGGLFGSAPAAPAAGGLFGSTTPAPAGGGLFGAPSAPTTPASGGLFGAAATPAGGLFGAPAPAPGTSLFGAPAPAPTGGLFGAPAPTPSQFASQPAALQPAAATVPVVPLPSAEVQLQQQIDDVIRQRKELEVMEAWRGKPRSASKVVSSPLYEQDSLGKSWTGGIGASSSTLLSYQAPRRSNAKIRPRGYAPSKHSPISLGQKTSGSPILSPNKFVGSTTKTLFVKPGSMTPKPKTRLLLTNGISEGKGDKTVANLENGFYSPPTKETPSPTEQKIPTQGLREEVTEEKNTPANPTIPKPIDSSSPIARGGPPGMNGDKPSPGLELYRQTVGSPEWSGKSPTSESPSKKSYVPNLTKEEYNVHPSIAELEAMSEADLAAVSGFKVERPGYGSVAWDGAVDVRGVDLDSVVIIERKNVSVYDEEESRGEKPEQGSKLNRPAVITMYGVFPKEGPESSLEAKKKMNDKIIKSTKKMGAELLSFEADNGVWEFRVGHFSRYGLDEDSDEESEDGVNVTPMLEPVDDDMNAQESFEEKANETKAELGGVSILRAPTDEDDQTEGTETMQLSEAEDIYANEAVRAGDAAAMELEDLLKSYDEVVNEPVIHESVEQIFFPDESGEYSSIAKPAKAAISVPYSASTGGICGKLASKCGLEKTTSSNIDFGLRMRRSFRVGWRPDGSFIHIKPYAGDQVVLIQSKPQIESSQAELSIGLLETHRKNSVEVENAGDAPLFTLPGGSRSNTEPSNTIMRTLKDYTDSLTHFRNATQSVVSKSFSLLTTLYGEDTSIRGPVDDRRRLEALSTWLKGVTSSDTMQAIESAQMSGDAIDSVFAALTGNDISRATSLALDSGNIRLCQILAASGTHGHEVSSLLGSQLEMWGETGAQALTPNSILRTLSLAAGTLDIEKEIFKSDVESYDLDWRRRFGMHLWSCGRQEENATISSIVNQYDSDICSGLVPSAVPLYFDRNHSPRNTPAPVKQCVLYQLLKQFANPNTPLIEIITPESHTSSSHDYSSSFHLCASVTALCQSKLSSYQENLVIDSMCWQLIKDGHWEWAVYVMLCKIGGRSVSKDMALARNSCAKKIVMRFYDPSADALAVGRRSFLVGIGIPHQWFNEANSYRCAYTGDVFGLVENLMRCSVSDALAAVETILTPHMILDATDKLRFLLHTLSLKISESEETIHCWNKTNGCGVIYELLEATKRVDDLSTIASKNDTYESEIEHLLELVGNLESMISVTEEATLEKPSIIAKVPNGVLRLPSTVYLSEVMASISILRLQLLALKNKRPLNATNGTMASCSSQLAFSLSSDGLFGSSAAPIHGESMLRAFCGFKA